MFIFFPPLSLSPGVLANTWRGGAGGGVVQVILLIVVGQGRNAVWVAWCGVAGREFEETL